MNKIATIKISRKEGSACLGCSFFLIILLISLPLYISLHSSRKHAISTKSPPQTQLSMTATPSTTIVTPSITTEPALYDTKIRSIIQNANSGNSFVMEAISNLESGNSASALTNVTKGESEFTTATTDLQTLNPPQKYASINQEVVQGISDYQSGTVVMKQGAEASNLSYASQGYSTYKNGTSLLDKAETELNTLDSGK